MFASNIKDFGFAIILTIVLVGFIDCNPSYATYETCEDELQRYPHPDNCSLYYVCLLGKLRVMECKDSLEFSAEVLECLPPEEANCQVATTPGTTVTTPGTSTTTETTTTEAPPTVTTPTTTTTTEAKCIDYEKYPHETHCNKYYLCLGGELYEASCPQPLHYNVMIGECDLPENANCQIFTTTTSEPCEDFMLYPHPFDCRKYYQCLNAELFLMVCPEDFAFNPERKSCDFPHLANCPTTPAKCENYKKYPHEVECNKYYYCLDENLFLMNCHDSLHFNWQRQDCDLPENAMCEIETRQ